MDTENKLWGAIRRYNHRMAMLNSSATERAVAEELFVEIAEVFGIEEGSARQGDLQDEIDRLNRDLEDAERRVAEAEERVKELEE